MGTDGAWNHPDVHRLPTLFFFRVGIYKASEYIVRKHTPEGCSSRGAYSFVSHVNFQASRGPATQVIVSKIKMLPGENVFPELLVFQHF